VDDPEVAIRYLNRSALKREVARWHQAEFERHEGVYSGKDYGRSLFLEAFGHADGVFLQLAGAFDAFACAAAYHYGLKEPDKADFANLRLPAGRDEQLTSSIAKVQSDAGFGTLTFYRNLAAHRGSVTERIHMTADETRRDVITMRLGDPLPAGAPDAARTPVREVLARVAGWAAESLQVLYEDAIRDWGIEGDRQLRADLGLSIAPGALS
jgi:hypothetical protein